MTDSMVFPQAERLLTCLCNALATNPNPPLNCCMRVGDVVYADFNQTQDQCCEGLAYVRIARIYPSSQAFPVEDETWTPCHPLAWAAELEMGVFRCEPQQGLSTLPSCDDWTNTAEQVANDWEAMTRALCCFTDGLAPGDVALAGVWSPLNSGGGCTGGFMPIRVGVLGCSC